MASGENTSQAGIRTLVVRSAATFVGLYGAMVGIMCVFLGMRAVMASRDTCATAASASVAGNQCLQHVNRAMLVGIVIGLVALALYTYAGLRVGPQLTLVAASGLFLSLSWNFVDFGLRLSEATGGWLLCATLFAVLSALSLAPALAAGGIRSILWSDAADWPRLKIRWFRGRTVSPAPLVVASHPFTTTPLPPLSPEADHPVQEFAPVADLPDQTDQTELPDQPELSELPNQPDDEDNRDASAEHRQREES